MSSVLSSSSSSSSSFFLTTNAFSTCQHCLLFCQSWQVNVSRLPVKRVNHCKEWIYHHCTCCFDFILTSLFCVCLCVCLSVCVPPLPPVAEHCGLSQPVRTDRNEPCRSVSRMFLLRGGQWKKKATQFPYSEITTPDWSCPARRRTPRCPSASSDLDPSSETSKFLSVRKRCPAQVRL